MTTDTTQLSIYEEELRRLKVRYWNHRQLYRKLEGDMSDGSLRRAFKAYRKNLTWYLCVWLRQDCAGRSGHCGRACGFCERPRETHRIWNRGHCTTACGCCIRTWKGCSADNGEQTHMGLFPFDIATYKTAYSRQINLAYTYLGLSILEGLNLFVYFR